jgi:hypothetical protein
VYGKRAAQRVAVASAVGLRHGLRECFRARVHQRFCERFCRNFGFYGDSSQCLGHCIWIGLTRSLNVDFRVADARC